MMCGSDAWRASLRRAGMQICIGLFLTEMSLTSFHPVGLFFLCEGNINCKYFQKYTPSLCGLLHLLKHTRFLKMCKKNPKKTQQLEHPSRVLMCHQQIHQVHAWNQKLLSCEVQQESCHFKSIWRRVIWITPRALAPRTGAALFAHAYYKMCGKRMSNISVALCEWHKREQGSSVCVCVCIKTTTSHSASTTQHFPFLLLLFFTLSRWNPFIHGQRAKLPFWVNKSKPLRLSHSDKHSEKGEGRYIESGCVCGKTKKTCCQEFWNAKRDPVRIQTICSARDLWLAELAVMTVQDQQHFHINNVLCRCFMYTHAHTHTTCVCFPIADQNWSNNSLEQRVLNLPSNLMWKMRTFCHNYIS